MGLEAIISVASGLTFFSMSGEEGPVAYNKRNKLQLIIDAPAGAVTVMSLTIKNIEWKIIYTFN